VFGHDVSDRNVGPAFQFSGAKAAFNDVDRFVVTMGNKLIVTTRNGDVFGHEIVGRNIGPGFKFSGSKAAFNTTDRFVVTIGNMLIVTTPNGDVFGHDVSGHNVGPPFKLGGSRMAFNPEDRFVLTVGNTMIVTTQNGGAFGADLSGRNFGPIFQLNPADGKMTAKSNNFQIRPEVEVHATGFTPNGSFQLTISHMPGKSSDIHRDHSYDGNGNFQLIEGFEIATISAETILPEIEVSMRDNLSGQFSLVHLSPSPFVVRV
jgi:hypothetical protein